MKNGDFLEFKTIKRPKRTGTVRKRRILIEKVKKEIANINTFRDLKEQMFLMAIRWSSKKRRKKALTFD